jgi:plasmid replication initiation protein
MRTVKVQRGRQTFAYRFEPGSEAAIVDAIRADLAAGKIDTFAAADLIDLVGTPPSGILGKVIGGALVGAALFAWSRQ